VLSLYQSAPDNLIHVYFGLELLEKVSSQREDVNFKLMVARLYNAGVKVRALEKHFQSRSQDNAVAGAKQFKAAMPSR